MSWIGKMFNEYFTSHDKQVDVNRDAEGKGTFERFIQVSELMLDEEIMPKISELQKNTVNPYSADVRYVNLLAACLGITVQVYSAVEDKRRLVAHFNTLAKYRGTEDGYAAFYNLIGVQVDSIDVTFPTGKFDTGNFDDPERTFDMACAGCLNYEVVLSGGGELTEELKAAIMSIEQFNRPIDAKLLDLRYNGVSLILLGDFNNDFNDDFFTG